MSLAPFTVERHECASAAQLKVSIAVAAVLGSILVWTYRPVLSWLIDTWSSDPDYSHGFLVPLFAVVLLWLHREVLSAAPAPFPRAVHIAGVLLLLSAAGLRAFGVYSRVITIEAYSLIPCLFGLVLLCGEGRVLRWTTPAIGFLVFMIPLPGFVANAMGSSLQQLATAASTYALQTLGIPAVANGNIISLTEATVGVAEACNGLRMLYSFVALSVAACLLVARPWWEKVIICVSAVGIAVVANLVRIVATAAAYEMGDPDLAEQIFHDFAGWLMMPFAMLLLWVELLVLSHLFIDERR
jgi:exosortase